MFPVENSCGEIYELQPLPCGGFASLHFTNEARTEKRLQIFAKQQGEFVRTVQEYPALSYGFLPLLSPPNSFLITHGHHEASWYPVCRVDRNFRFASFFTENCHRHEISCMLAISNNRVVTASSKGKVKVWNVENGRCLLSHRSDRITCMASVCNDQQVETFVVGTKRGFIYQYQCPVNEEIFNLDMEQTWMVAELSPPSEVHAIAFPNPQTAVASINNGHLFVFNTEDQDNDLASRRLSTTPITALISVTNSLIAYPSVDFQVSILDLLLQPMFVLEGRSLPISIDSIIEHLALLSDGSIVGGFRNGELKIWPRHW